MLYLDIGNSNLKMKTPLLGGWTELLRVTPDESARVVSMINATGGKTIWIASVRKDVSRVIREQCPGADLRFITVSDFGKNRINYLTPDTLGVDRVLACEGARVVSGGEPVTVIDAGSACTVDIMDHDGVFHGGVIMPGLKALESSLKVHAPELPGVERRIPDHWPGKSTTEAIQWGVTGLFVQSVRWIVERYRDQFGDLSVWVTGGDAANVKKYLGGAVTVHPDLVVEGMRSVAASIK
ncbi:MAG: type III pantothenate kinase [Rhodothermaceae bacterium]|nr:type III pantothenate kinase [Rhodothermaceae bacterium]